MYFKNKVTGITWHITDEAHQKRLQANDDYIEVANSKGHEEKKPASKEQINKPVKSKNKPNKKTKKIEYSVMDWHELRQTAAEKGINTKGMKRDEIEKELIKLLGDAYVTE